MSLSEVLATLDLMCCWQENAAVRVQGAVGGAMLCRSWTLSLLILVIEGAVGKL